MNLFKKISKKYKELNDYTPIELKIENHDVGAPFRYMDIIIPKKESINIESNIEDNIISSIPQMIISYNDITIMITNKEGFIFSDYPKEQLVSTDRCKNCKACMYHRPSYGCEGSHYYTCILKNMKINDIVICKYTGDFYNKFFATDSISYASDISERDFINDFIKYHIDIKFGTALSTIHNKEYKQLTMFFIHNGYIPNDNDNKHLSVYLDKTVFEGTNLPLRHEFLDLLTIDHTCKIGDVIDIDDKSSIVTFSVESEIARKIFNCMSYLDLKFVKAHYEKPSGGMHFDDNLFLYLNCDKVISNRI